MQITEVYEDMGLACDRLVAGGGREAQANMEETEGERLPWVEAHNSWPSRKEHLEILASRL